MKDDAPDLHRTYPHLRLDPISWSRACLLFSALRERPEIGHRVTWEAAEDSAASLLQLLDPRRTGGLPADVLATTGYPYDSYSLQLWAVDGRSHMVALWRKDMARAVIRLYYPEKSGTLELSPVHRERAQDYDRLVEVLGPFWGDAPSLAGVSPAASALVRWASTGELDAAPVLSFADELEERGLGEPASDLRSWAESMSPRPLPSPPPGSWAATRSMLEEIRGAIDAMPEGGFSK